MLSKIYTLELLKEKEFTSIVFEVRKDWILHFQLDSRLDCEKVKFYCNHSRPGEEFSHDTFVHYPWESQSSSSILFPDSYAEVCIHQAGVFKFYLEEIGVGRYACGCFIVQPDLILASGKKMETQSVTMQTVLTKCLGAFKDWRKRLQVAYECNYNTIHFTPIQERGKSNSSYSIRDHHAYDPRYGEELTEVTLNQFIKDLHQSWNVFSLVDVVWNHVSNDCKWIMEHPEASYNLINTLHLRPAFLVDRLLWYFNKEIIQGVWKKDGIPNFIDSETHLLKIASVLRKKLKKLQLEDFYTIDIESTLKEFDEKKTDAKTSEVSEELKTVSSEVSEELKNVTLEVSEELKTVQIIQDESYKRFGCKINMDGAIHQFTDKKKFKDHLESLNKLKKAFIENVINKIVDSTLGHICYHFVESHGPKLGAVTDDNSIALRYFCFPYEDSTIENDEKLMDTPKANLIMAHNGWVAGHGHDVLEGFIGKDSLVFLFRELHAWDDAIKLRYGDSLEEVPFLWNYMRKYTEDMARNTISAGVKGIELLMKDADAENPNELKNMMMDRETWRRKIFHGVRLDNCHGTPFHVGEYLLNCARKVRPDLFVIAELFTSDEQTDNIFVNKLGINTMIRENLGAYSPYDLGHHIYRYGGPPTGSFMLPNKRELLPTVAPSLYMDITHDNESLFTKRSVFDFLPSCALVAAGSFAIGSTRGFDEIVPHHIHVVTDNRMYQSWSDHKGDGNVFLNDGLINARKTLNEIHTELRELGFTEIFVDQMTKDIVAVTRHCPDNHHSVIIVGHCAHSVPHNSRYPKIGNNFNEDFPPLIVEGQLEEILFEGQLLEIEETTEFECNKDFVNGNTNYILYMQKNIRPARSNLCALHINEKGLEIRFKSFFPGSVLILKVSGKQSSENAISNLRSTLNMFPSFQEAGCKLPVDPSFKSTIADIKPIMNDLSLVDLNKVLYRCDTEEKDDGYGGGVYDIPGFGRMVYCGLQGIMSVISDVAKNNDLGHPICDNLRQGDWMLGYTANRLKHFPGTKRLATWLESVFDYISVLPRFLIPSYFEAIIRNVYEMCIERSIQLLSNFVQDGSEFTKHLSMATVQLCGEVKSASLPAVEESASNLNVTLAAGLPHFATGFMRCWGRDTFIALRGLMLVTGRFDVARTLILSFGGCVRHGLLPNLLVSGINARYNARDATWFWLQAVQEYTKMADEGVDLLNANVLRMYPKDDSDALVDDPKPRPLHETIHEILTCHYNGISFTERNAGERLDRDMSEHGFYVRAGVNGLGFVEGGSEFNCGTWMDKMGGSIVAKNKGVPATPRCGSAVEIVGLSKSTLRWLIDLHEQGKYPHDTIVVETTGKKVGYKDWESKIQENFDKYFFISETSTQTNIHKRNIYRDTFGSNRDFLDNQLRPNFPIAMCVAPEMFDPEHAWKALDMIETQLLGPLGVRTLDPHDWTYDGFYENDLDNTNHKKAKGFNYHNGPEWVWVLGPYLRARLIFARILNAKYGVLESTISKTRQILSKHKAEIMSSPWKGLTELTNKDGEYCSHSCPTQAWSSACLLEVLYDVQNCST